MKHFTFHRKSDKKKFPSPLLFPVYALCGLLLVIGVYRLSDTSTHTTPASYASSAKSEQDKQEAKFQALLKNIFQSQVTSNTLNLHYTLADPSAANIGNYPVTFGEISSKQEAAQLASLENMKNELSKFDPASLPLSSQITYDILMDSINRSMALAPYYYYNELLSSTGGIQSEYPILLAEYTFHSVKDVEEYLTLLSKYDTFFQQLCSFEKEKAKQGLFMNETAADNLIAQCKAFIPETSESSFWETTFEERLDQIKGLSKKEKQSYLEQNKEMLQDHVYPAYHNMIAVLKALKKEGKNPQGLCYFEKGKQYYELLVKSTTGSERSIPELQKMVEEQRDQNLDALTLIASKAVTSTSAGTVPYQTPEDILEHLKTQITTVFPAAPKAKYTVKNVSEKLQEFLSPAFYLTAPIDQYTENCIYINPGNNYNEIELFTTLAHEGYPGHLYQTIYAYSKKLAPIRYILYHGGYTEGWATYVEMLSYDYAGLDANIAKALMLNQDATLSLYATIDMGIHYDGWTLADTVDFLGKYGITETSVISNIYQSIIENPANYLKYYIGYLEFLNLKKQAKEYYGNDYSELTFHTTLLNMGSAPFYILEKYFVKYYKAVN
ncbi:MAG: DUF885 domain-containing protein [Eubacterium sp.]|nr:DUF885 domain-containing protein [Eubacterium sp.]